MSRSWWDQEEKPWGETWESRDGDGLWETRSSMIRDWRGPRRSDVTREKRVV